MDIKTKGEERTKMDEKLTPEEREQWLMELTEMDLNGELDLPMYEEDLPSQENQWSMYDMSNWLAEEMDKRSEQKQDQK